ncbi:MAG: eL32 family ribosomal protein [Candidatus Marsarchaeota archaeon]|nr:eL32 family ribosomal protein [Candidatus Marsarchaeota archaeon]MCL5112070.1 eL32 family ribosomal protein [Candidatus Marsarchaeota archaeon]
MMKRSHPKFNVPNFGARSRKRVPERWRKQRGIDNKKRTKKSFMGAEPNIGYGNPKSVRGVRASGKRLIVVHNVDELVLAKGAQNYEVAIAHGVSKRKRAQIVKAAGNDIRIVNSGVNYSAASSGAFHRDEQHGTPFHKI